MNTKVETIYIVRDMYQENSYLLMHRDTSHSLGYYQAYNTSNIDCMYKLPSLQLEKII